jgi:hypothetical protein
MLVVQTFVLAVLCTAENTRGHAMSADRKGWWSDALCDINVKEVDVEPRLHESRYDSDGIYHVFGKVSAMPQTHGVQRDPHVPTRLVTYLYIQFGMYSALYTPSAAR